jgi:hypothetical protein
MWDEKCWGFGGEEVRDREVSASSSSCGTLKNSGVSGGRRCGILKNFEVILTGFALMGEGGSLMEGRCGKLKNFRVSLVGGR